MHITSNVYSVVLATKEKRIIAKVAISMMFVH